MNANDQNTNHSSSSESSEPLGFLSGDPSIIGEMVSGIAIKLENCELRADESIGSSAYFEAMLYEYKDAREKILEQIKNGNFNQELVNLCSVFYKTVLVARATQKKYEEKFSVDFDPNSSLPMKISSLGWFQNLLSDLHSVSKILDDAPLRGEEDFDIYTKLSKKKLSIDQLILSILADLDSHFPSN